MLVEFLKCHLEWNPLNSSFEKSRDDPWQSVAIDDGEALYFRFSSAAKPELLIQGIVDIDIRGDLVYNNTDLRTGMHQGIDYFSIKVAK